MLHDLSPPSARLGAVRSNHCKGDGLLATTFLTFLWTLIVIFFMVIFFILLFHVIGDLFSRHDASGWKKAAWVLFLIVFPFLGLFVYYICNADGMAQRQMKAVQKAQGEMDDYIRDVAATNDPTAQIAQAKGLLDSGAITQEEFDQLKAKALAGSS
jgi:type VI protein secretion system component VasK